MSIASFRAAVELPDNDYEPPKPQPAKCRRCGGWLKAAHDSEGRDQRAGCSGDFYAFVCGRCGRVNYLTDSGWE